MSQHLLADAGTARALLGWIHGPAFPLVERSVAWHLAHPPEDPDDLTADDLTAGDAALAHSG